MIFKIKLILFVCKIYILNTHHALTNWHVISVVNSLYYLATYRCIHKLEMIQGPSKFGFASGLWTPLPPRGTIEDKAAMEDLNMYIYINTTTRPPFSLPLSIYILFWCFSNQTSTRFRRITFNIRPHLYFNNFPSSLIQ